MVFGTSALRARVGVRCDGPGSRELDALAQSGTPDAEVESDLLRVLGLGLLPDAWLERDVD